MTQCDRILAHLKAGRTLTPVEALRRFGTFRLAARINELREQGVRVKTDRHPKGYAVYRI